MDQDRLKKALWNLYWRGAAPLRERADPAPAEEALEHLIGLAVLKDHDYVHSENPVAAARIVVSDLVADLWASVLRRHGMQAFTDQAMSQLLRWEQEYGWTRIGAGPVADQEVSLASVVAKLLPTPDTWIACADA